MATVNFYRDMQKALLGAQPKIKVQPISSAPGTSWQVADRLLRKAAEEWEAGRKEQRDKDDLAQAMKMIEDYTASRTPFSTEKYGTSPEDLRVAAEGYDGDDEQILSDELQDEFYTDEAARVRKAYETGEPAGAALVRQRRAEGAYNMPAKGQMGDRARTTMTQILLGEKSKRDAAKLLADARADKKEVAKALAASKIETARAKRGNVKYGNTPIWGTDKDGRPIVMQPSSAGGPLRVAELPEGVTAQRGGTRTVDLGDRYAVLDANGSLIGYRAKGIDPEKTPGHVSTVAEAKAIGAEVGKDNLIQYNTAKAAYENQRKNADLINHLETSDARTGLGAEFINNIDRVKALFGDMVAAGRVADTEELDVRMGSEVFPLIKSLGIGARGMDTPAEREFMRQVLTGRIGLNKETLLRMARMRSKEAGFQISNWNKRVNSGELDNFFKYSGVPKGILKPFTAPISKPIDISGPISKMNAIQLYEKARGATAEERRQISLRLTALGH